MYFEHPVQPESFIHLKLESGAFPILSVLNGEDHQHANDIRDRIDDQLPSVAPMKNRSGHEPNESYQADGDKCGT
jgi:hypothetical protein